MAKMTRWERAWGYFLRAFYENRVHKSGYSKKKHPKQIGYYWKLVNLLKKLGISVWLSQYLGTAVDAYGRPFLFPVSGLWSKGEQKISLTSRDFGTLSHEAAHGLNEMLGGTGTGRRSEDELVASAVGYLLACEYWGMRSPGYFADYAKRWGATPEELSRLEEHILVVFHEIKSLLDT